MKFRFHPDKHAPEFDESVLFNSSSGYDWCGHPYATATRADTAARKPTSIATRLWTTRWPSCRQMLNRSKPGARPAVCHMVDEPDFSQADDGHNYWVTNDGPQLVKHAVKSEKSCCDFVKLDTCFGSWVNCELNTQPSTVHFGLLPKPKDWGPEEPRGGKEREPEI